MVKRTPFRDRMRRVFSRASSSASNTTSENANCYGPSEKIPSKYSGGASKPHQDRLAAWSFENDSRRRASSQSMESPMGSRVHSRVHSRNPSKDSNILKEERTIEEIEESQWNKTDHPSETASEATLRERDQNLHTPPKTADGAALSTGETGGRNEDDLLRQEDLSVVGG